MQGPAWKLRLQRVQTILMLRTLKRREVKIRQVLSLQSWYLSLYILRWCSLSLHVHLRGWLRRVSCKPHPYILAPLPLSAAHLSPCILWGSRLWRRSVQRSALGIPWLRCQSNAGCQLLKHALAAFNDVSPRSLGRFAPSQAPLMPRTIIFGAINMQEMTVTAMLWSPLSVKRIEEPWLTQKPFQTRIWGHTSALLELKKREKRSLRWDQT